MTDYANNWKRHYRKNPITLFSNNSTKRNTDGLIPSEDELSFCLKDLGKVKPLKSIKKAWRLSIKILFSKPPVEKELTLQEWQEEMKQSDYPY